MLPYMKTLRIEQSGNRFKIISERRLTEDQIHGLRRLGFLGYGQEFHILSACNGTELCDHSLTVPSPYGEGYLPVIYYVYDVKNTVDSSD